MRNWAIVFLLFPFVLFGEIKWSSPPQGDFSIEIQISNKTVNLGESIRVEMQLHYPENYLVDSSSLVDRLLWSANPISPVFQLKDENRVGKEYQIQSLQLDVEPLQAGSFFLSFLSVNFSPKGEGEKGVRIETPVFPIQVNLVEKKATFAVAPLHPLEPEMPLGLTKENRIAMIDNSESEATRNQRIIAEHTFPWIPVFCFAGIVLAWLMIQQIRGRIEQKKRSAEESASVQKNAEKALNVLKSQDLPKQGRFKEYFTELNNLVWTYLEKRYALSWNHYTTSELASVQPPPSFVGLKNQLISLLTLSDKVKFAEYSPSLAECDKAFAIGESLIKKH